MYSHIFFAIFFPYVVNYANAATTTLPKNDGSTVNPTNVNKSIIWKFAGEERNCECVFYFDCRSDGAPQYINPDVSCFDSRICCKNEFISRWYTTSTTTSVRPPTPSCKCVPRSKCVEYHDSGVQAKQEICDGEDEVCCSNDKVLSLRCGERRGIGPRISSDEFPWMGSLWVEGSSSEKKFVCGASILSSNLVLTAAHCLKNIDVALLSVRVGDSRIKTENSAGEVQGYQERKIHAAIVHPDFNAEMHYNNLAVLVTAKPFTFTETVHPVCTSFFDAAYTDPDSYNSSNCFATGWGKSSINDVDISATLKKVKLQVVPSNDCQKKLRDTRLGDEFELHPSFLCAGGVEGIDTCEGDGGGPLFCQLLTKPRRYVQIGITSWGIGCGTKAPGVYASLEANKGWLFSVFQQYG